MRGSSQWWECCETHTHLRSSTRNSSTVCPDWHRVRLTVLLNSFHQVWSANFPCYGQLVVVGEVWVVPPLSCTHHLTITTTGPLLLPPPSSLLSEPDLSLIQSVCCLDVPYNWHSWELLSWLTGCLWRSCRPSVVTQQYTKSCRPSALQLWQHTASLQTASGWWGPAVADSGRVATTSSAVLCNHLSSVPCALAHRREDCQWNVRRGLEMQHKGFISLVSTFYIYA